MKFKSPCPAESELIFFENTVDSDQLIEAIWS